VPCLVQGELGQARAAPQAAPFAYAAEPAGEGRSRLGSARRQVHNPCVLTTSSELVGREKELAAVDGFLDGDGAARVLLLEGEAGIGKTVLLERGLEVARAGGLRVLRCSPGEYERELAYTGLSDLFGVAVGEAADELARPRRRALEVALMLAEPEGEPPDSGAIALGILDVLRLLARGVRVVVAVDDVQWLDVASATALGFAVRRLEVEPVALLLARRGGGDPPLGLKAEAVRVVEVGPLSVGALHRMLVDRVGRSFSRPVLKSVHETSAGNPFYALELALALERQRVEPRPEEPLPVPVSLETLVGDRLAGLSAEARRVAGAAALLAQPTRAVIGAGAGFAEAVACGVLREDSGELRFTHPLLAAAARSSLTQDEARALHAGLALTVEDATERARHRALAAVGPDEDVAAAAEAAARVAAARGARSTAATLLELAVSLTPPDTAEQRRRRTLSLARELAAAGNAGAARALLEQLVDELPAGGERSEALLELAWAREDDAAASLELSRQALAEADSDERRALAHHVIGGWEYHAGDLESARAHLREAVALGSEASFVAGALAWQLLLDTVVGASVSEATIERALALDEITTARWDFPARFVVGMRRMYEDRHDEARGLMLAAVATLQEHFGPDFAAYHFRLADLEVRTGRYPEAARYAADALANGEQSGLEIWLCSGLWATALVDAHLGRVEEACAAAERAVALARAAGTWVFESLGLAVLGFLELSLGRAAEAAAILEPLAERHARIGLRDPSMHWGALPNAVEALIATGELERARTLLVMLEEQGAALPGPYTRARAARAAGLLAAAEGRLEDAITAFARAQPEAEIPLERGRTLLALGATQRLARQRKAARETLQQAVAIFDELGATLWAERARDELGRIGGRAPSPRGLTPTERRVAALVAEGKSNKEVAAALVVSVHTVEAALTAVYRKLDVHSRTEMARKLAEDGSSKL
jgi:DNA-binding NarL/FixJ family response regulator